MKNLNEIINETFKISAIEHALIDYSVNILIPQITNKYKEEKIDSGNINYLIDYSNIFLRRFSSVLGRTRKYQIEIMVSQYIIGIKFIILKNDELIDDEIKVKNMDNESIVKKIVMLGNQKVTDNLFVQKDIRGIDKNLLYILNRMKNNIGTKQLHIMI